MIRLPKLNRCGMTMIEVIVAFSITALMVISIIGVMFATTSRFQVESTQGSTDTDASLALQMMVSDIREAKQVTIQNSGAQLLINYPVRVSQTQGAYYDRSTLDNVHTITYYLSDSTHAIDRTGSYLWRWKVKDDGTNEYRCIRKDIASQGLLFETDVPKLIQITIKTKSTISKLTKQGTKQAMVLTDVYTQLSDRVVYLRNY